MHKEKFQRLCREAASSAKATEARKAKQMPLFTKATGVMAAARQAAWRARPLTDGSPFPFGKYRDLGSRMEDVPMKYYRWFLEQEWSTSWPAVAAYAQKLLTGQSRSDGVSERRGSEAPVHRHAVSPALSSPPKSDPAKAQAAFEEFQRQKELLK
jgi:hypothetical protein